MRTKPAVDFEFPGMTSEEEVTSKEGTIGNFLSNSTRQRNKNDVALRLLPLPKNDNFSPQIIRRFVLHLLVKPLQEK